MTATVQDFVCFWGRNVVKGWHGGHWTIGLLEGLCLLMTIWLRLRGSHGQCQGQIEEFVKGVSWKIFLYGFLASTLLIAPFEQWNEADQLRANAQTSLDDRAAKLIGFIDQTMIWNEPGTSNAVVVLQLSINNSGGSGSLAEYYKIKANLTNGNSVAGTPIDINDEYSWSELKSNTVTLYKLKRAELISEKTMTAIQPGYGARGWLAFRLPGLEESSLMPTNCDLIVSFSDVGGKRVHVTNGIWNGLVLTNFESEEFPRTLPGSGNLVYTNIALSTTIDLEHWEPPQLEPDCTNISVLFGNQVINIPRWQAEISPEATGGPIPVSDIPENYVTNLEKMPNYSPRRKNIYVKTTGLQTAFGNIPVSYPFWPYVLSNRLYLYVQVPYANGIKKLIMNDAFDSLLPNEWDRNYGTNIYAYEIVNENKRPVLQVAYSKPNEIYVNGIFVTSSNSILTAFCDEPKLITVGYKTIDLETKTEITNLDYGTPIHMGMETNTLGQIITNALYDFPFTNQRTIFKYPSNRRNIGVFNR